jgi:hypothetical protein
MLAADAIAASSSTASANNAGRAYSKAVDRHLVADHRMSAVLSKALSYPRGAQLALRLVDTNDWTRRNFVRWMFEDEPRAVLATPRRWHRGFLKRDGAYL